MPAPLSITRREFLATSGVAAVAVASRLRAASPAARLGIQPFRLGGEKLIVPVGLYDNGERRVRVTREAALPVAPADIVRVEREELQLSEKKPSGFFVGTRLQGPKTSSIAALNSLIEDSLVLTDGEGRPLRKGDDYLVAPRFALLGLGTNPRVTPASKVFASYSYYRQRIDTVAVDGAGVPFLLRGTPRLVSPERPSAPVDASVICSVYRPFRGTNLVDDHIFPIRATADQAPTASTPGQIPRTLEKLRQGKPVTVVCWGDSITVGADVRPEEAWANRVREALNAGFPEARFTHRNHSIGGTKSAQWLHNGNFPGLPKQDPAKCRFDNVLAEKPDVVLMEFLNDIVLEERARQETYEAISRQFRQRGIEWVIVTPSHKMPEDFDLAVMKSSAPRPLDAFLQEFAQEHGHALADASARWRHLHREGIPYFALFNNGYNHPNALGHALFVEEIMKCFSA